MNKECGVSGNSKQQPKQKPIQQERRHKIVYVPHSFVMNFLTFTEHEYITRPIIEGLPKEGCEVKMVQYFPERVAFGFIIYHESFEIIPLGERCPEIIVSEIIFKRMPNYSKKEKL